MSNYTLDSKLMTAIAALSKPSREAAMREIGTIEWGRCAADVMYWVDEKRHPAMPYVYTHDPHVYHFCSICNDENTYTGYQRKTHLKIAHSIVAANEVEMGTYFREVPTIRPFPLREYMPPIIDAWMNEQYVFIEKSRDMTATWLIVMLYTWDTLFHQGRQNIFQSESSRKTFDLVKRGWIIYKNQPKFLRSIHKAHPSAGVAKSGVLRVDSLNSEIMGFPQGAEQMRQYHPSGIFLDEAAYLVDAGPTFAGVKPAIEAGGRFSAVSSANPSWFWHATADTLDTL